MKELETEFSEDFVKGMQNRMIVSFHKYGPIKDAYPHKVNALKSLEIRINKYKETKNTEYLIDAANFLMIEFMYPSIEGAYFKGTDSNESPGRISTEDKHTYKRNEDL